MVMRISKVPFVSICTGSVQNKINFTGAERTENHNKPKRAPCSLSLNATRNQHQAVFPTTQLARNITDVIPAIAQIDPTHINISYCVIL